MENFPLADIKRKNHTDIFRYIYHHPGCSRQTVADALSMSLPTVTQHLNGLMTEGLIQKTFLPAVSAGRRAASYAVIASARISLGVEILSDRIYIVALNLYGQKEFKEKKALHFTPDKSWFYQLKNMILEFLETHQYSSRQLLGIGLGIQGLVSQDGKTVTYGKILNCTGLSIEPFAEYFDCPCRFYHDPECAAFSELWENPDISDAIYLSLGPHLGGAVIQDRTIRQGMTGKTGTFEHMTLIPDGLLCYCGKRGCAECYCSAASILSPTAEPEEFFLRKQNNDPECTARWQQYLQYLALLISNLHLVLDEPVILGGYITPYFTDEDIQLLRNRVYAQTAFGESTDYILVGKCRVDAVSTGAALPYIQDFLKNPDIPPIET